MQTTLNFQKIYIQSAHCNATCTATYTVSSFPYLLCIHNYLGNSLKQKRKKSRKYLNTDKTTALDNVTNELECSCLQPHAFNSSTLGPSANCNQVSTYLQLLKGNSNTSSIKPQIPTTKIFTYKCFHNLCVIGICFSLKFIFISFRPSIRNRAVCSQRPFLSSTLVCTAARFAPAVRASRRTVRAS